MAKDLFSVPIFFIVFRETIEAAIIVSVLLSFVEQLMITGNITAPTASKSARTPGSPSNHSNDETSSDAITPEQSDLDNRKTIIKRMRIQIWAGTLLGFFVALCIGAAFIAVFYTSVRDLWADTEQIWEGVFSIIASVIILIMGIAFLKMDRSRIKWRLKLAAAFQESHAKSMAAREGGRGRLASRLGWLRGSKNEDKEGRGGKWALFLLPFITVIREGLEAVVFVGGVSMNLPAESIPIPVIVGLICGAVVGYAIYRTGSTATLHWFLIGSTCILFLIGAGLASKGVGFFEYYVFAKGVGGDVAETGDGPGSFRTKGNVWHLTYGNPETGSPTTNGGWQLFNAILGWNNTATLGSVLSYVFYWIAIMAILVYMKWKEGRVSFCGFKSADAKRREAERALEHGSESEGSEHGYGGYAAGARVEEKKASGESGEGGASGEKGGLESPAVDARVPVLNLRE